MAPGRLARKRCSMRAPASAARRRWRARPMVWWRPIGPGEQRQVSVAFSTDGGATWGAPIPVDDGRPVGRVDIEMLGDGSVLVSWLEEREPGAEILARQVERSGRMGKPWVVARTSEERASGFPRMVRAGNEVVFAWVDVGEGGVRVAVAKPAS